MKSQILPLSTLSLCLWLGACSGSSSSDDAPAPAPTPVPGSDAIAATDGSQVSPATVPDASPDETPEPSAEGEAIPGELQDAIKLNSSFLEYSRMQYDCGDITAPLAAATVEANLKGAKSFETLAATIPAKDQALVRISTEDNGVSCSYRAIFTVNKAFTEVTYHSSQALDSESVTACGASKAAIDEGFGTSPVAFDYDKKFIRWVALHIPDAMQIAPVCPTGKLRAVFAGATL